MIFSKESKPEIILAKQKVGMRRAQVWVRNNVYVISRRYVQTLLSTVWIEEIKHLEHCSVVWELFLTVPASSTHLSASRREWTGRKKTWVSFRTLWSWQVWVWAARLGHFNFKRAQDQQQPHYLLEVHILGLGNHKHRRWRPATVYTSPLGDCDAPQVWEPLA